MSAATATSIMQTFGNATSVKIKRVNGASFDPILGIYTGGTPEVIDTLAVTGRLPDSVIDGDRIFFGDKSLTISADTPVLITDIIEISGDDYQVIDIDAPMVNDEILYYRIVCRG